MSLKILGQKRWKGSKSKMGTILQNFDSPFLENISSCRSPGEWR